MKTLTIIGNGFDLGHGLPTRFDDFINSNPILYREKYGMFSNGNNSWNEIESKYEDLLCSVMNERYLKDPTEELDRIRSEYGMNDYGEVNYYGYEYEGYDEEISKITDYIGLLEDFEHDFLKYLNKCCNDSILRTLKRKKHILEIIASSERIITFNYTHTLETLYGARNIIHIHGDIDDTIAIGSGALEEVKTSVIDDKYPQLDQFEKSKEGLIERMAYYTEDLDGRLVEDQYVRRFFDEIVVSATEKEESLFSLLDAKSKDSLAERQDVIDLMGSEYYDVVHIIGHSLGKADLNVFEAINKAAKIICYYHDIEDCKLKEAVLNSLGFNYEMVSDANLYA